MGGLTAFVDVVTITIVKDAGSFGTRCVIWEMSGEI